jgi:hypothetical protein
VSHETRSGRAFRQCDCLERHDNTLSPSRSRNGNATVHCVWRAFTRRSWPYQSICITAPRSCHADTYITLENDWHAFQLTREVAAETFWTMYLYNVVTVFITLGIIIKLWLINFTYFRPSFFLFVLPLFQLWTHDTRADERVCSAFRSSYRETTRAMRRLSSRQERHEKS